MALKNRIQRDNHAIFMNQRHFAETHVLNGFPFTCVLDDIQGQYDRPNNTREIIIYALEADLPIRLESNQEVFFDNMRMVVTQMTGSVGMKEIHLSLQEPYMR